jgi:aryl-alcohol dehydrogenase-like predicted oxidoreductase
MGGLATRTLGRTGLEVSVLGFGSSMTPMRRTNDQPITQALADTVLNSVLDAGINYIDTAIDYGESEVFIGQCIAHRRTEYVLAAKCGCPVNVAPSLGDGLAPHVFTRENIIAGVEQSLTRLQTDYLDVLQVHNGPSVEILQAESVIETLTDLQQAGKVRFLGSSAGSLSDTADHIGLGVFDVVQMAYSALERDAATQLAAAARSGAGTVVRGGIARGGPGVGRGDASLWARFHEAGLDDLLDGASRSEFMLRYTISNPDLATTIVGTLNLEHLAENLTSAQKGPLSNDVYAEATRRLDALAAKQHRQA